MSERKLGHAAHADEMLESMIETGREKIRNAHRYGYYGVGMASPLPFELDCKPVNTAEGLLLTALGMKGLGREQEAEEAVKQLEKLDPYNFKLCFIRKLGIL